MLCTLVNIGDKEDNHCQEEGHAKSVWRETRIFGGNWIVRCSLLNSSQTGYRV
jgi:hypothetical protein